MKRRTPVIAVASLVAAAAIAGAAVLAVDPGLVIARQDVRATLPSSLRPGVEETVVVRVARHRGGAPVAGAEVRIEIDDGGRPLASEYTGEDGLAVLRVTLPPETPRGRVPLAVKARSDLGADRVVVDAQAADAAPAEARVLLAPVKALFQPGEKVQVRALVLSSEGRPVEGLDVAFDLLAPGAVRVARERTRTSGFGVASAEVPLDAQAPEGWYRVRLLRTAPESTLDERDVLVKRHRLPAFAVGVTCEPRAARPGQVILARAAVATFDGQPVAGARLTAVLRDDAGDEVARAAAEADATGAAGFSLRVPPSIALGPARERRLFVEVEAEDTAGRTARGAAVAFATEVPLRISVLPEGGALVPGVAGRVYLVLEGPGGAAVKGVVAVARVPVGESRLLVPDAAGLIRLEDIVPSADEVRVGHVELFVHAWTYDRSAVAEETLRVRVDREAPGLLRCERAIYREGERIVASLHPAGGKPLPRGAAIPLVVERAGRAVATGSLEVGADGIARGEVALPAALSTGVHRVTALLPRGDDFAEVARTVLVRPAEAIDVALEVDRQEVGPGGEVRLRARVRPASAADLASAGPAVLGIQAVDRAVAEMGHAFDLEGELRRYALAGDPEGRLARAFAARLLDPALDDDARARVAVAALGGAPPVDPAAARTHVTTVPTCRAEHARMQATVRHYLGLAGIALIPGLLIGLVFLTPRPGVVLGWIALAGLALLASTVFMMAQKSAKIGDRLAGGDGASPAAAATPDTGPATATRTAMSPPDAVVWAPVSPPRSDASPGSRPPAPRARADRSVEPRRYLPETLLFLPQVLTDERGEAEVTFRAADVLTEWRIDVVASTRAGAVAHGRTTLVVRQPFKVDLDAPAFVREGDEIEVAAAVRNDGAAPVEAALSLEVGPGLEPLTTLDAPPVPVGPGEVAAARFRVRAARAGETTATVRARTLVPGGPQDAATRTLTVLPVGRPATVVVNGDLDAARPTARVEIEVPGGARATERSLVLRLTPSPAAEAVEGLERLLREPHGCFEQTSSATWPNALVLGYLRQQETRRPEAEARAQAFVRAGYQRLLGFEVRRTGGFSLYGQAPASPWLSAYGLRELADLAREIEVDPELIARTRRFLASVQRGDGGFPRAYGYGGARTGDGSDLDATAYVLAALVHAGARGAEADRAGRFVVAALAGDEALAKTSTYALALSAEALLVWGGDKAAADRAVQALAARAGRETALDGAALASFEPGGATLVHAYGGSGTVETTAIAARTFVRAGDGHQDLAAAALRAIVRARAPGGAWATTQATVQALSALIEGASIRAPARGSVDVFVNGTLVDTLVAGAGDDRSVGLSLGRHLPAAGAGPVVIELRSALAGVLAWQVVAAARVPWDAAGAGPEPAPGGGPRLTLDARLDSLDLAVGGAARLRVEVANVGDARAAAPLVDLPLPAGFEVATPAALDKLVRDGFVLRHEALSGRVVLYLRDLAPSERCAFGLPLVARFAGRLQGDAARAYPYYDPDRAAVVPPATVRVERRP